MSSDYCEHCEGRLVEIDHYGERLRGCPNCNRWQAATADLASVVSTRNFRFGVPINKVMGFPPHRSDGLPYPITVPPKWNPKPRRPPVAGASFWLRLRNKGGLIKIYQSQSSSSQSWQEPLVGYE
jgi:hypothetical protein